MGMRTKGQGTLKFDNYDIILLLKYHKWCCSDCDELIFNKVMGEKYIPLNYRKDPLRWVSDPDDKYSLQNFEDINVIRKKPRGTKGNNKRLPNGKLNYDNLLLLCHSCNEKRSKEKKEQITFRTSKEKKEWLEKIAKDKDKGMAELMNDIIDKYGYDVDPAAFSIKETLQNQERKQN